MIFFVWFTHDWHAAGCSISPEKASDLVIETSIRVCATNYNRNLISESCLFCADARDDNFAIKITNKYVNCLICNLIVIIFIKRDDAMLRTMIINELFFSSLQLSLLSCEFIQKTSSKSYLWHGKRWWDNEYFLNKCLWYANLSQNSVRARKFTGNVIYHILRLLHRHLISRKHVSNFFPLLSQQNIKTIFDVLLPFALPPFHFLLFYNEVSMRFLYSVS